MDAEKIQRWSELLLDTGKRNNLVNFKDTSVSLEVVLPSLETLYAKIDSGAKLEVFSPEKDLSFFSDEEDGAPLSKEEYVRQCGKAIKRANQIVIYNRKGKHLQALRSIAKKATSAMEETGVNIAYLAIGFIHWSDGEQADCSLLAPVLLAPISVTHESTLDPYLVTVTDDILVNPTFSYKLQSDHGIRLNPYDEEMGIAGYLDYLRALLSNLGWEVSGEIKIGLFSFLKINMYRDLEENAEKIVRNANVLGMMGSPILTDVRPLGGQPSEPPRYEIRDVVDADHSQMEAIRMVRSGKSFVLQGPPGTGKSQTITNIVAECLAEDKKVLFVSEKLAALKVVYDKLKAAGLEDFCLELHSHKANKKDVVNTIIKTIKTNKSVLSSRATGELEELSRAEKALDDYAEGLHKLRPDIDKTLYQLLEESSACRTAKEINYLIPNIRTHGADYLKQAESALSQYAYYSHTIGNDYRLSPWYGFIGKDCTYEGKYALRQAIAQVLEQMSSLKEIAHTLQERFGIYADTYQEIEKIYAAFSSAHESKWFCPALTDPITAAKYRLALIEMKELAAKITRTKKSISEGYEESVFDLDAHTCLRDLTTTYRGWFKRLTSAEYKALAEKFTRCSKLGSKQKYPTILATVRDLSEYQEAKKRFSEAEKKNLPLLGHAYLGAESDFDAALSLLDRLDRIEDGDSTFAVFSTIKKEEYAALKGDAENVYRSLRETLDKGAEGYQLLTNAFASDIFDVRKESFTRIRNKLEAMLTHFDKMEHWCDFRRLLETVKTLSLTDYLDAALRQEVSAEELVAVYRKIFLSEWIDLIIHDDPTLSSLTRIPHDEYVSLFKEKDQTRFEINKAMIKAQLSAKRPDPDMVAAGSATAIILREGEKKRKLKSIRTLLSETGDFIQTVKPCFLMSPLSVSTYLDPDTHFDVVVFDEASQIFPQDAIGAIYRGDQLIVVGDSKQMPPSNFFNSVTDNDEEDETEDITDFESILDLCSTFMPQLRLKWHYRSRFEQLIAFSNKNFYDNDLVTFPSALKDEDGVGVDYHFVNGTFDRKSKTNKAEAEYIVDCIYKHFETHPERSLGVVAFSISQQELIERLLSVRRQKDPSKESFFRSDKQEPFFVKNLETVQGDERDTIIFSIAYAPDEQGRFLMNFGPLNKEGGERRLNVAVTRAKYNVQLVASIHSYDIDLTRTSALGPTLLREYLDFAENGAIALQRSVSAREQDEFDSDFESEVCEYLRENGFSVDSQVGCSSFRIDLAVKHPSTSDYVLAVECDGASYHSSKEARDRDRLRQEILERMGWRFYRIWSTDWFRNKAIEKARLLEAVKDALSGAPKREITAPSPILEERFDETVKHSDFEFPEYRRVELSDIRNWGDMLSIIYSIVKVESPIAEDSLLKRIVYLFGKDKVTPTVRDSYNARMRECEKRGVIRKDGFLYLKDAPIPMLRIPPKGCDSPREIKNIALSELAMGLEAVVKQNVTIPKSDLFRFVTQKLGFSRTSEAISTRMESALSLLKGRVEVQGDVLNYVK